LVREGKSALDQLRPVLAELKEELDRNLTFTADERQAIMKHFWRALASCLWD
jgi:CHASE3 domain sensor protein